jgi:hypothetical protein
MPTPEEAFNARLAAALDAQRNAPRPAWRDPTASEVERAQRNAVGGKKDKCVKGKSCSAACITPSDVCLVEIPLSPSQAISRVRDQLKKEIDDKSPSKEKQLKLFETSKFITAEGVKERINKFQVENQANILKAIDSGSKETYDKHRQEAIDFNKSLVKSKEADKGGLAKVPVTWEKMQDVKKRYEKAQSEIEQRAINAAMIGDKTGYLREEKKLIEIEKRLGSKVGEDNPLEKGYLWRNNNGDTHAGNEFFQGLRNSPTLKGATIRHEGDGEMVISRQLGKHKLELFLEENGTVFSFKIDGSYDKPSGLSNREGLQIAATTQKMFDAVTGNMNIGSVISVFPYDGDGRGDKRRRAYERYNFGSSKSGGSMYGKVDEDTGEFSPASGSEWSRYRRERDFNFAEPSPKEKIKIFYTILWGEEPG